MYKGGHILANGEATWNTNNMAALILSSLSQQIFFSYWQFQPLHTHLRIFIFVLINSLFTLI
jgi:hypothetical protein